MYGFDTAGTLAEETNDPRKQRAPGDHPRGRGGLPDRRPRDPARDHVEQEHRQQEHRAARPAVRDQAGVRQHDREHVPRGHGARDLRLLPGGPDRHDPDAVLDGARQPAAVGSAVARVSGHRKVPIVPALVTGVLAIWCCWRSTSATRARSPRSRRSRSSCSTSPTSGSPCRCWCVGSGATWPKHRPRAVLLARALGAAGQHRRGGLRCAGRDQHRVAAGRGLQRRSARRTGTGSGRRSVHRGVVHHRHASTTSWCRPRSRRRCSRSTEPRYRSHPCPRR